MLGYLCRVVCASVVLLLVPTARAAFSADTFMGFINENSTLRDLETALELTSDKKEQREISKQIREEKRKLDKASREVRTLAQKAEREGINVQDKSGRTLLMMATQLPSPEAVDYVMLQNPDLTLRDKSGRTALEMDADGGNGALSIQLTALLQDSVRVKDFAKVRECCKAGVSPNEALAEGPLAGVLLQQGQEDLFVEIFRGKHFKDAPMADGTMLSQLILLSSKPDVIKIGGEAMGKGLFADRNGDNTTVMLLMVKGNLEGVKMYAHQVGLQRDDVKLAVRHSTPEVVGWVLSQDIARNMGDALPHLEAARRGNQAVMDAVIGADVDLAAANGRGETVLMHAALSGNAELVGMLMQKVSAEVLQAKDSEGRTAIYYARLVKNKAVEQKLTAGGLKASDKDKP